MTAHAVILATTSLNPCSCNLVKLSHRLLNFVNGETPRKTRHSEKYFQVLCRNGAILNGGKAPFFHLWEHATRNRFSEHFEAPTSAIVSVGTSSTRSGKFSF